MKFKENTLSNMDATVSRSFPYNCSSNGLTLLFSLHEFHELENKVRIFFACASKETIPGKRYSVREVPSWNVILVIRFKVPVSLHFPPFTIQTLLLPTLNCHGLKRNKSYLSLIVIEKNDYYFGLCFLVMFREN